ncbi:M42 family metallopeptidase [Bacillus horti]|uniref:Endoglucanase n=1 Tax=Caldalkalibacillus horti TaxID=77523 RepID=A0ABT9VWL2_9BACI|nr:M42 family metallopeptidase [Bacillus horti]MDQ0165384.1 endoglucanase [Bacillus horti]
MSGQDTTLQMFKELTECPGVPGNEHAVKKVMEKWIEPHATELQQDHLGSLIAKKTGQADGPKIMVAGHLDEIGFMITQITESGFLKFQTLGGWWEQVMLAQRVLVLTRKGEVEGVIGSKPPHILPPEARKKSVNVKEMFIDIGAASREEAEEFGVRPGDTVVPICPFTVMKNPKLLMAKAWDNRIGCAIAIDVMKRLKEEDHPNTFYGVGTVQEEVGLRGAQTAGHFVQPDISFAVDVGIAGDTPGIKPEEANSKIGKGPQIILYDASMIAHKNLTDFVVKVAEENQIPYQFDFINGGGTDAGRIQLTGNGVPSLAITIATRYIHSHAGILHRDDYDNAVNLLVAVIKKLDAETVEKIKLG